MDDALSVGVARIGLAVPTSSLGATATFLIPDVTCFTGAAPERALIAQRSSKSHQPHFVFDLMRDQRVILTGVFMHTEFSTQPPLLGPSHSLISLHTLHKITERKKTFNDRIM